jgi:hypothetical protein
MQQFLSRSGKAWKKREEKNIFITFMKHYTFCITSRVTTTSQRKNTKNPATLLKLEEKSRRTLAKIYKLLVQPLCGSSGFADTNDEPFFNCIRGIMTSTLKTIEQSILFIFLLSHPQGLRQTRLPMSSVLICGAQTVPRICYIQMSGCWQRRGLRCKYIHTMDHNFVI